MSPSFWNRCTAHWCRTQCVVASSVPGLSTTPVGCTFKVVLGPGHELARGHCTMQPFARVTATHPLRRRTSVFCWKSNIRNCLPKRTHPPSPGGVAGCVGREAMSGRHSDPFPVSTLVSLDMHLHGLGLVSQRPSGLSRVATCPSLSCSSWQQATLAMQVRKRPSHNVES